MIRVAIADDEALMRHGLRMLVDSAPDLKCIGEASNGKEALALAPQCDVLLLDLRMPLMDGLEALERIKALGSGPEVLVLTAFDTQSNVLAALNNGAIGFLLKTTPPLQLIAAIRAAAASQTLLSPSVLQELLDRARPRARDPRMSALSERELEVGQLIASGKTNQEISAELYLSLSTVKTHIARIMEKLDCTNRVQVAIKILEHNAA
ncbi:response regulator transcription factor [Corynebacterium epidermidicanis]|uniref:Two component system response regulator n=1 Tax=Corynebacterium epidermidicanis TaxID=1050174 RepID=A0A0G3GV78_9CORY|nr:response regulator transcription factor [Corynebacterium epidermidicanis]AKK03438.1 two component system response regulator [Corynebacterium epidermidicanis]